MWGDNHHLLELWRDGDVESVVTYLKTAKLQRVIDFCRFVAKYEGERELQILSKLV
jgi:hypothetical protein